MPLHMQIIVVGDEDAFDFTNVDTKDAAAGIYNVDVVWHVVRDSPQSQTDEPGLGGVVIYSDLNENDGIPTTTFDADFII